MFVMYFPQMIEAGMVYKAIPPLYSIKQGKNNKYFTEQIDIIRYVQKNFLEKYKMSYVKGSPLQGKEVTIFFMKNVDYIYYIDKISKTFAINTDLLELILNHYVTNKDSINFSKLQKEVRSKYRFMDVEKVQDTVIVKGTIDKCISLPIKDKFLNDCKPLIDIIKDNDCLSYDINGNLCSIYEIMKLYKASEPSNIQRYKGLGEMNRQDLAESTLYPGSDRTLVRYTLQDAKEEIEAIREYESDSKKILSLVGNVNRDDLLD